MESSRVNGRRLFVKKIRYVFHRSYAYHLALLVVQRRQRLKLTNCCTDEDDEDGDDTRTEIFNLIYYVCPNETRFPRNLFT